MTETSTADQIAAYVSKRVTGWQELLLSDRHDGEVRALLSSVRRADPLTLSGDPKVWASLWEGLPERLVGKGDILSPAEQASYSGLVLYANHQQSKSGPMHVPGLPFGTSARRAALARGNTDLDAAIERRFSTVALAGTSQQRLHHLRQFISLLRAEGVGTDYGQLAKDLYHLTYPDAVARVRTRWGRDFYTPERQANPTNSAVDGSTAPVVKNGN